MSLLIWLAVILGVLVLIGVVVMWGVLWLAKQVFEIEKELAG